MLLYTFKQFGRCKKLRIATYYLQVILAGIGEENKVLDYRKQPIFAEHSLNHRIEGVNSFRQSFLIAYFIPRIEVIIVCKQRAILIVYPVTYDNKGIVFEQVGNIPCVTHLNLLISVVYGRVFFDRALELQYHKRKTVDEYNAVRYSGFLHALYFKLIYNLEDVVVDVVKVDKAHKQILFRFILAPEKEPLHHIREKSLVCFIKRLMRTADQLENDCFNLIIRNLIDTIFIFEIQTKIIFQ